MKKLERVSNHFSQTLVLDNQMKSNGEKVSNLQVVEKILQTLTMWFKYKETKIEELKYRSILLPWCWMNYWVPWKPMNNTSMKSPRLRWKKHYKAKKVLENKRRSLKIILSQVRKVKFGIIEHKKILTRLKTRKR